MKAGTTSFAEMLSQHPDIFLCPIKEPHHFIQHTPSTVFTPPPFDVKKYLKAEKLEPLHLRIIKDVNDYEQLFRDAHTPKYLTEASTGYLHAPESAELIHKYNPTAKIIILTRDPLKRAYSHYKMNLGLGRISQSFEQILQEEIQDFQKNGKNPWNHLGMSLYKNDIERYQQLFGDNLLTISFENLIQKPHEIKKQIISFLEVDTYEFILPHENSSKEIKYKKLVQFLFKSGLKNLGSKILPKQIRTLIFSKLQSSSKSIELSENTLNKFNQIISQQNQHA